MPAWQNLHPRVHPRMILIYHAALRLFSVNVTALAYVWSILALVTGVVILLFDRTSA